MNKSLAAFTTAFVIGAAGSTAAASNPFSDVPAGHWAYDAMAQLAADGVIEGYGDGTFRGDREITRFEMAQLTAKAMAKNPSGTDKAMLDRLAAEFSEELNNLGVRVSNLEKHADRVKWNGTFRYRYGNHIDEDDGIREKSTYQYGTFRLEPSMEVNDHWNVHARIDYNFNFKHDMNVTAVTQTQAQAENEGSVENKYIPNSGLRRAWVQGDYENFRVLFGKLPYLTNVDHGMIYDHELSGVQVTFGKKVKATLTAGRSERYDAVIESGNPTGITGSYQAAEIYNDRSDRFTWGLGFHRWSNRTALYTECGVSGINIYEVGLGYKFDKNFSVTGAYAWTNAPLGEHEAVGNSDPVSSESKRAFSIEFDYKKADPASKGSFGLFAAYRQLGHYASIAPTYDAIGHGQKGMEIGVDYVFDKNVMGTIKYFLGKKMPDEDGVGEHLQSAKTFFAELNFFF